MKNLIGITILLVISGISQSVKEECVGEPRDLFFLVDHSGSIGRRNFKIIRNFLGELVSSVLQSSNGTHIGFLQFSTKNKTEIKLNLDNNLDAETIRQKFENMTYERWLPATLTHHALEMAAEKVFTKSDGDRPNVPDIVVVITDGQSNDPNSTKRNAQILKERGVRIIAIGVYNQNSLQKEKIEEELNNVASSPKDKKIIDFDNLQTIVNDIVNTVCRNFTTSKPTLSTSPQSSTTSPQPSTTSSHSSTTSPQPSTTSPHSSTTSPQPSTTSPQPSTTSPQPSTTSLPPGCSGRKGKDILFVVDGTANSRQAQDLAEEDFRKIKAYMKSIIRGLRYDNFMIGVMQYTDRDTAKMEIDFTSSQRLNEILIRLGAIRQQGGYKRYTGDALVNANNKLYVHDHLENRSENPDVIILITRGTPNDRHNAIREATSLKRRDVILITVGLNTGASDEYLQDFLSNMTPFNYSVKYTDLKKNQTGPVLGGICGTIIPGNGTIPPPCQPGVYDIFFVVDGSASIQSRNFLKVKNFLLRIIPTLNKYSADLHTGLMQFSIEDLTLVEWGLGKYSEKESIRRIQKIKYQAGGRTAAGDALTRVSNEVFTGTRGDRPNVSNVLILFTDGDAHDLEIARKQADILKKKGIFIITVGAGTKEKLQSFEQVLSEIASAPDYAITVDFNDLEAFAESALSLLCRYLTQKRH